MVKSNNKIRYKVIDPDKTRVVFFDLEYYVPPKNRKLIGLNYNPAVEENVLLGGGFLSANPTEDLLPETVLDQNRINHFWIWYNETEAQLLKSIYKYLKEIEAQVYKHFQGNLSPVVCGIGISNSDIPVLFHLFNKYSVDTTKNIFEFQNVLRVLDLSQLAIGAFNKKDHFLYPKTKNEIMHKFQQGKTIENGKSVWDLYEAQEFKKIESRVTEEVNSTVTCYKAIKQNFDFLRQLEAEHKKQLKDARKNL